MELLAKYGNDHLASVYLLQLRNDRRYCVECAESIQPPRPRHEKWVMLISTLFGCPVGCSMCDAGSAYHGKLTVEEMAAQIQFMAHHRFGTTALPIKLLKIQLARMGEPAFNPAVLDLLTRLPSIIQAQALMPSISTIAPVSASNFFASLCDIKNRYFPNGAFQLQFSIHSTDGHVRQQIIPLPVWDLGQLARFGSTWHRAGDRKITLNFAPAPEFPIDSALLEKFFNPEYFLIKLTPLNPTEKARLNGLTSMINPLTPDSQLALADDLRQRGFEVLISIGEPEENGIGSNCGQYITRFHQEQHQARNYSALWQSELQEIDPLMISS